jgi:hypothetical protein
MRQISMPIVSPDGLNFFFCFGLVWTCKYLPRKHTHRPAYDIHQYILETKYGLLEWQKLNCMVKSGNYSSAKVLLLCERQ